MSFAVNKSFGDWANSFAGCDGGNIDGAIWFCGIEFSGKDKSDELRNDVANNGSQLIPSFIKDEDRAAFISYQYNWRTLKLYASILSAGPARYRQVFEKTRAFDAQSDVFKLNLYPIAFSNTDNELWKEWHYKHTGFPTKELYQSWCQQHRFATMKSWVDKHAPKAIIGTASSYRRAFLMAFAGPDHMFKPTEEAKIGGKTLTWYPINNGKTVLFVTPFLGTGGLMSDDIIRKFGQKINEECENHFGAGWCRPLEGFTN